MTSHSANSETIRTTRTSQSAAVKKTRSVSLYCFMIGFFAFVAGMAMQQGVIGGIGFVVMAVSAMMMNTALWNKVSNSASVRYFRTLSQIMRSRAKDPE